MLAPLVLLLQAAADLVVIGFDGSFPSPNVKPWLWFMFVSNFLLVDVDSISSLNKF
jgi:hypothetical protein